MSEPQKRKFWAIDCNYFWHGVDGELEFCYYSDDGKGNLTCLQKEVTNIAPDSNVELLGEQAFVNAWLLGHKRYLDEAKTRKDDPKDTDDMSEKDLRYLQLREIRHMLNLTMAAPHQEVLLAIKKLYNGEAPELPERYR